MLALMSVIVDVRDGKNLSVDQVRGIIHLVASAVEGLDPSRVTVVDARGTQTRDPVMEREHLEAILSAPDDDAPRLVYADWLLSQGDPRSSMLGELIQLPFDRIVESISRGGFVGVSPNRNRTLTSGGEAIYRSEVKRSP